MWHVSVRRSLSFGPLVVYQRCSLLGHERTPYTQLGTEASIVDHMKRQLRIAIFFFLFAALSPAAAEPLRQIEMDEPTSALLPADPKRPTVGPRIIERETAKPITTTVDLGTKYGMWRTTDSFKGNGLVLRIDRERRAPGEAAKSKIEINVARHDDFDLDAAAGQRFLLRNGTERYVGFALKLDPKFYEAPRRWVLHFQAWQCCGRGSPPLSLRTVPARPFNPLAPISFALIRRTDADLESTPNTGEPLRFIDGSHRIGLQRGRWYRIVFRLRPGLDPAAGVSMWVDGVLVLDYRGRWGYSPDVRARVRDTYSVKLGIYRHAHDAMQQVELDSIRWGLSREEVDPDRN
jgi:hypothetical protein